MSGEGGIGSWRRRKGRDPLLPLPDAMLVVIFIAMVFLILKIQIGKRQVSECQVGDIPFGLSDELALSCLKQVFRLKKDQTSVTSQMDLLGFGYMAHRVTV